MRWIVVLVVAAQPLFGCVTNVIPFAVSTNQFAGKNVGDTFILSDTGLGSGNYGKVDLANYQTPNQWLADMVPLGCGCQVCNGIFPLITGNTQVKNAFGALAGSVFVVPLLNSSAVFLQANIVGFVLVREVSFDGSGSGWTAILQLLSAPFPLNDLTADSDGDGWSDVAEFQTGTNPTNGASFFGVTSLASDGHDLHIAWTTATGKTNALERGDSFTDYVAIFAVTNATGTITNYVDSGAVTNSAAQYYRVRLVP